MPHTAMLVWLDMNASLTTQMHLRAIEPNLRVFSDLNAFIEHITTISTSVVLIVSSSFGEELLPIIDALPQLCSIYVYCTDANNHIHWAEQCTKIGVNRVFIRENDLIEQLTIDLNNAKIKESMSNTVSNRIVNTVEQDGPKISVFAGAVRNNSTRDLTEEKVTFTWLQILTDILMNMPQLPTARDEMIDACRLASVNNLKHLQKIEEFRLKYKPQDAVYCYTRPTFLYQVLNRALRTENVDIIFKFRMIIVDLYRQLSQLFEAAVHTIPTLTVYRGQRMKLSEIDKLRNNISGLISMNSFISTTNNEEVTCRFLSESNEGQREETEAVLFKLTLNAEVARETNKPFAGIRSLSYFPQEEEVLLCMGTVFRIEEIEQQPSGLWHAKAIMCTDYDDPQAKMLFDYSKAEICSYNRITYSTYGKFLALMSHFDSAIDYLSKLLSQQSIHSHISNIDRATIHNDLAYAYRDTCCYSKALKHYKIALDLKQNQVPLNEVDLATTYSDMGWLLMNTNDLQEACKLHEQALTIRERDLGHDHSDTAMSYNCLGLVHVYMFNFDLALEHLVEALFIRLRCLPSQHPYTAMSYSSFGSYFDAYGDDAQALEMYERALSIYKSSVPPSHHILESTYRNVSRLRLKQER